MTRSAVVALVLVALAGVSGCDDRDPPGVIRPGGVPVTVSPAAAPPATPYLAPPRWSRDESALLARLAVESTVMPGLTDQDAVRVGHAACRALDGGVSVLEVVRITGETLHDATAPEFVGLAIVTLCPRHLAAVAAA